MPSSAKLKSDAIASVERLESLGYGPAENDVILDAIQKSGGSQFRAAWFARSQFKKTGMSFFEIITLIKALITIWSFLKDRGVLVSRAKLGTGVDTGQLKSYLEGIE